jgi:WD40 repeat protein
VSRRQHLTTLLLILPLAGTPLAKADAPPARTDRDGEPLPSAAVARLGTLRWRHLNSAQALVTLSPDGTAVGARGEGGFRVWDTATGKPLAWLEPDPSVRAALFTPDGKTLLTASQPRDPAPRADPHLVRWVVQQREVGSGKVRGRVEFAFPLDYAYEPHFSPDGKFFLAKDRQNKMILWDTATGERYAQVECTTTPNNAVALSPDGKALAAASQDGHLYLHELPGGRQLHQLPRVSEVSFQGHFAPAFSPDGRTLATAGPRSLFLWDVAGGKLRHEVKGCHGRVAFSRDGKYLACGDSEGIRLLDAATFAEVRRLEGHDRRVDALFFSADGKRLLSAHGCTLALWDVATGRRLNAAPGHEVSVVSLAFAPDGRSLASGGDDLDGTALVWDLKTGRPRHRFTGHFRAVASLAFSPDGTTLATGDGYANYAIGSNEAEVRLWDLGRDRLVRHFVAHLGGVSSLAYSPDGKSLLSAGYDARFRMWDAATGERRFQVRGLNHQFRSLAFSPDGRSVLAAGSSGELALWDAGSGEKVRDFGPQGNFRHVRFAGFVQGGKVVLSQEYPRQAPCVFRFWDVKTGSQLRSVKAPSGRTCAHGVALSPDGTTLAVVADDSRTPTIQLWDAEAERPVTSLRGHANHVQVLAFSPDGKTLASGGDDTTVLLWDVVQARLEALWGELGERDAPARRAADDPARTVAFLKERLAQAGAAEKRVRALLPDLDNDSFEVREKATAELGKLSAPAESALREALKGSPSEEAARRIQRVLDAISKGSQAAPDDGLRLQRMVKVLEAMNTPEARQALRALARGEDGLTVTRLAREATERLDRADRPR